MVRFITKLYGNIISQTLFKTETIKELKMWAMWVKKKEGKNLEEKKKTDKVFKKEKKRTCWTIFSFLSSTFIVEHNDPRTFIIEQILLTLEMLIFFLKNWLNWWLSFSILILDNFLFSLFNLGLKCKGNEFLDQNWNCKNYRDCREKNKNTRVKRNH